MSQPDHPFSLPRVVRAYCSAVTVASAVVALKVGFWLLVFLWVVAFVLSLPPYAAAIVVARRFSIRSWWYFIGGGLVTASAVCIVFALITQYGPLGPVPDEYPPLSKVYAEIFPVFWFGGAMAGLVSWLFFRRGSLATDAQPCGQPDLAHKAAQGRLP